jgi:nucleoside-diphosphate-sugar epimerase
MSEAGAGVPSQPRRLLVTGGAGFLGRAILRELRKPGAPGCAAPRELVVYDARPFDAGACGVPGVRSVVGDVRRYDDLLRACRGMDAVLHAASLVDYGHATKETLEGINVGGTENVIRACREAGVPALVYTSTMDVVCDGDAISNADETRPYPSRFQDDYARTKATAEQAVIAANGPGLRTCSLRPCGMYGEEDPYHVSNILRVVREGKLVARMGTSKTVFQHAYVGNVAHAHLLALRSLSEQGPVAAGQVYILTDHPAVNFFEFIEPLVNAMGHRVPPRWRTVPFPLAYAGGAVLELVHAAFGRFLRNPPALTRSSANMVCKDLSFDGSKARRDLGYEPVYSEAEALDRTIAFFREHGPVEMPVVPELETPADAS